MSDNLDMLDNTDKVDTTDPYSVILHSVQTHLKRVLLVIKFLPRIIEPPPQSEAEITSVKVVFAETLRSEIVLLHAILEDSLREILRLKLKDNISASLLAAIPLVGIAQGGQPKKFGLEDLVEHRGETVNQLIEASIDEFLNRTSFTSSKSIVSLLQKSGFDDEAIKTLNRYFPSLDRMITRRHQIVHRADRVGDIEKWAIPPVDPKDVIGWLMVVFIFVTDISFLVHSAEVRAEMQEEFDNDKNVKEIRTIVQQYLDKGVEAIDTIQLQGKLEK